MVFTIKQILNDLSDLRPGIIVEIGRGLIHYQNSGLTEQYRAIVTEKLDAMVVREMLNNRMKDYYDLSILIRQEFAKAERTCAHAFDGCGSKAVI